MSGSGYQSFLLRTESVPFDHSCSARHDCLLRNRKRVVSVILSGQRLVDWRQEIQQRNIQKNVNVDLYLGTRSRVDISHHWLEAAAFSVTPRQTAEQGRLCTAPLSAGKRDPSRRQTNSSCPSQPFRDNTSQFSSSCFLQQNNLCSRLQQHSSKCVAYKIPHFALSVLPPVNLPQRYSCLEAYNLEGRRSESIDFPQQHHQKAKAAGSCSIHAARHRYLESRKKNSDYPVEKQQHQPPAASCMDPVNASLVNACLSSCTVDSPLRHELVVCPSSRSSSESVNTCHSSALTLGDLDSSSLESLQSLLQSSQISASLYCSIQRLKQETALMGIWGSLPLEPKSSAVSGSLCFAAADSASSILSTGEQLAGVKTSAAQARLKWEVPFAKDWSLSAVTRDFSRVEPLSVSHRYGRSDLNTWRTKISGDIQPETLASGVGSGGLVDTEADSSYNCSPYFRCQSQAKPALETGSFYVRTRSHSPEKVLKGEETSDGASPCAVSWKKDLPASLYPEGLQVSLETDLGGAQMNVGVAMYGIPREVCVRVASPSGDKEFRPVQQLSIKSVEVNNSEPHFKSSKESEYVCGPRSRAARRVAVVGSSQSSPFGIQVEEGFGGYSGIDCMNVSREGRRNDYSYQSSWRNWEADANLDQSEEPSVERSAKEPQCCEEGSQEQEIVSGEVLENSFWSWKVNEQSFQHLCDRQMLTRCFQAWRGHILWKRAAARQLYRQQLLRKGLGALQWAVHQRKMQLEVAQQRRASALLAVSFCRWKEAVTKRSKKQSLQPEPYSHTQSSSVGFFGVGRLAAMTTSAQHQLTVGYSKEAEQACRVEGGLWTQLHRRQRGDEFCWRAQAIRDMRRLAAFRLWRLQKELLSKEEARLLEVRALLEKKQLRNIFWVWRSRCLEMEQVLALTTQIQRNLVSRCFSAWKMTVEQKALYRCNLVHLRAVSLRKYFQQWVQMLQVREGDKQAMVNFFLIQWRQHYGPVISSVADKTATERHEDQPLWTAERPFPEKTGYTLDDFSQKVKLQRVYLLWKARLREHHRADSFSQTLEQCRLRKALKFWHQKCLMLKTIEQSPNHSHRTVCEEPLAMLFSEDLSTSSGFDSNPPATLASQSSLEKEYSFSDSSQQSLSSILTAEDVTHMPYYSSFLQLHQCTELPAEMGGELYWQASFPPRSTGSGRNWFVGGQFQSLALQSPDNNVQPLTSYSTWEEDCGSDKEVKSCWHQAEKRCLQRYFIVWSARTQQLVKAQQYCRLIQLSRAFLRWYHWVVENKNRKAAAALKHRVHCCQMAFSLWKKRLAQKVEADRRFRCHIHQLTADALWCWHSCWQRKRAVRELQQRWAQHSCQEKKRLVLQTWYCQARKQKYAALFWERLLLHRCLVTWAQVTACRLRQHEALSCFKRVREHRLLVVSFTEWRVKLLKAEQRVLGERNYKWQEPSQGKACHRWRLASRGQQALRLGSVATVKQACNYWTKAAAFSQCLRQCSTLIGARKSRKISLSRSMKNRRGREKDSAPAAPLGLFPSAIHRWLVIYRNQNRAERLLFPHLVERPGVVGPSPAHARIQENKAEVNLEEWDEKWLGTKYLRWWHHTVILRRCRRDRRLRRLARGWHQWREASRVAILAQVLDQQRLIEKAWRVWRRRHLQSCVVQNFLEEEARSLLSQAFGRWRQLTAFQLKDKGCC
ncbi:chloride transport protein 6 isoform X2 [Aquila chrysaetos chrysaetos]|uniref:chloride transport protein 6 isoform X2 n=1 Tax=Aquila chrysaetos chrysaetos TaxID=223781 RepID=UPI001B7D42CD|nr:chloride transport protein 6 isoform X2 [Aquila chrysaetos chrysaetos]